MLPGFDTVVQSVEMKSSIKYGGGRDLSPGCHRVPAFHPDRRVLLDDGPDLRLMTGPGEGFMNDQQTKADREGPTRCLAR